MATLGTPAPPAAYARLADERLAVLARQGDAGAGAAIHDRYAAAILRYARSIVRDPEDAQDVLQQTMLGALQAPARRDLQAPRRPWLFRVAHNTSISLLRRRRPADVLDEEHGGAGRALSAEAELLARERLRELVEDVAALPERQRTAILLHDVAGLPHELVAGELGCTGGASRQTVSAARSALRDAAAGRELPCAEVRGLLGDRRRLRARPVQAHLRTCAGCAALAAQAGERRALTGPGGWTGILSGLGAAGSVGGPVALSGALAKTAAVVTVVAGAAVGGLVGPGPAPPTRHVASPAPVAAAPTAEVAPTAPAPAATPSPASDPAPRAASGAATPRATARTALAGSAVAAAAGRRIPPAVPAFSFAGRPHRAWMPEGQSPTVDRVADRGRLRPTGVGHATFGSGAWRRSQPAPSGGRHRPPAVVVGSVASSPDPRSPATEPPSAPRGARPLPRPYRPDRSPDGATAPAPDPTAVPSQPTPTAPDPTAAATPPESAASAPRPRPG